MSDNAKATETYAFQAEINQLLSLIINAFYSNKDIFLRELISNASDALDKIRYKSLTDKESNVLGDITSLKISLVCDKTNNTVSIQDTGIGMTKDELIKNLGTIAHSGTKQFMEAVTKGHTDVSLIGQFGVGFYSAYLIADRVTVISKHNDEPVQYVWESNAGGTFTVAEDKSDDQLGRGTRIILHLKEDAKEYLEESKIREIIKKHSEFTMYPIELLVEKQVEVEESAPTDVEPSVEEDGKVEDGENEDGVQKEKKFETRKEWEQLNKQKPIWTRPTEEITKEEYATFYKSLTNDWDTYSTHKHFKVDGQLQYTALLYVPKRPPMNMFDPAKKHTNLNLYVRRVFIMNDCDDIIPEYLDFVKGIVDSEDLPLNVSREILQQNRIVKTMKKTLVKRCLEMFSDLAEDKEAYKEFYTAFSKKIKLGVYEDTQNRDKLVELLRFESSTSGDTYTTLSDYVAQMKDGQKDIYYITGESKVAVEASPFVEKLKKKGYEVIYMTDPMDEYMMQQLREYKEFKFLCITKEGLKLDGEDDKSQEDITKEYEPLCKKLKELLDSKVQNVVVSNRLVDSPCVVVTDQYGWSANMERIMKAQALRDTSMNAYMASRKILEINPDHPIVKNLKSRFDGSVGAEPDKAFTNIVTLMYETSMLASGFAIENPMSFSKRIFNMVQLGLNIDCDQEEADTELTQCGDDSKQMDTTTALEEID